MLSAQPKQPAPQPAPHKPSAAKKAAPEVARATRSRVALSQSRWPANDPPAPPTVTFNSQGLHIVAENSALSSILNQVSTETGAKVEGLSGDERVFGSYGPGQPREVLADLLSGINYNVLIVGDAAQGLPLRVVLSPRQASMPNSQPNARPPQQDQDEDYQPPQPEEPPQFFQPPRPPMNEAPNGVPITPQDRLQMMQRLSAKWSSNSNSSSNRSSSRRSSQLGIPAFGFGLGIFAGCGELVGLAFAGVFVPQCPLFHIAARVFVGFPDLTCSFY